MDNFLLAIRLTLTHYSRIAVDSPYMLFGIGGALVGLFVVGLYIGTRLLGSCESSLMRLCGLVSIPVVLVLGRAATIAYVLPFASLPSDLVIVVREGLPVVLVLLISLPLLKSLHDIAWARAIFLLLASVVGMGAGVIASYAAIHLLASGEHTIQDYQRRVED